MAKFGLYQVLSTFLNLLPYTTLHPHFTTTVTKISLGCLLFYAGMIVRYILVDVGNVKSMK